MINGQVEEEEEQEAEERREERKTDGGRARLPSYPISPAWKPKPKKALGLHCGSSKPILSYST